MTVIGVQDFISAALAQQVKPASLKATASTVSTAPTATPAPAQTEALSTTIPDQSLDTATFNNASVSAAQYGSLLQVAQGGADDIQSLMQQLHDLAGLPAAGQEVSTATLAQINTQFQQILSQINRIATSTTFNGASVLDGTFSSQQLGSLSPDVQNSAAQTLPDLTTAALFNGATPNLLTPEAAAQAVSQVADAKTKVDKATSDLSNTQDHVEYASASIQTALTNVEASTATISDSDIDGSFENLLSGLLVQPSASAQLQASNISPSLLSLLQDGNG